MLKLSRHAQIRMQQSGKTRDQIRTVLDLGKLQKAPGNASLISLPRDYVSAKIAEHKHMIQTLESCKNVGVLINDNTAEIITVMHMR